MSIHRRSACTSIPPEITAGVCAVVNPLHWNWNQFRLPVPLEGPFWKTTKRFCTPEAPETVAVTVCHDCQPPVLGIVACASSGPVGLPEWNSSMPVLPLPFATDRESIGQGQ